MVFSLAVQGPLSNTLQNFDRAADSVACGAELAMNQTRELVQRATTPLLPVLNKVKAIMRNARHVADRVSRFIRTLIDSVRHVARVLRNTFHFLVNIGEVCNEELGTPYRKCIKIFDDAQNNCMELLSIFSFLCYILDIFRPLCGLAHIVRWFCVIPSYVMSCVKARISSPTISAFKKMQQEFEFNISASTHLATHLNSSQSIQQLAHSIMGDVTVELYRFQEFVGLFGYVGVVLLLLMYLQALLYKNRYLFQDDFDNVYITRQFVEIDMMRARQGKTTLLPLSREEVGSYITPYSLHLTKKERQAYALDIVSIFRHMLIGFLVVVMDFLTFWVLDMVRHLAQGEVVARAPMLIAMEVNGSGYASDIFKDIVASFDILQKTNISVLSKKCLIQPSKPDYMGYLFIGLLYGLSFFIVIAGSYVTRLRRFICASYYPDRERERTCFLYNRILCQRVSLGTALLRSVQRKSVDKGHSSLLLILAAHIPGFSRIAGLLGATQRCCLACGKIAEGMLPMEFVPCVTPQCKGLYCRQCFSSLDNICSLCMRLLTFPENHEEELDSSDEETVGLWTSALKSLRHSELQHRGRLRKLLKQRIKQALRKRRVESEKEGQPIAGEPSCLGQQQSESDTSSNISSQESHHHSDLDFSYQEREEWNSSDTSTPNPQAFLEHCQSQDQVSLWDLTDRSTGDSEDSQNGHLQKVTALNPVAPALSTTSQPVQELAGTQGSLLDSPEPLLDTGP
nr:PREDICTED: DC-STAMP domain-containing protein 2 isoform X4 [Lepisosteus oculatus]XP_015192019.1 PREDICTED: DC-STAMP domain-containing protein 2 isoform X4 [Lepisosteus oculatus]XP_015192020.1 PREDICTED: DC-STAMP domain-containing protein 2 isoform X4 [Lepisosteus oculatus]